jgi:hypothetical protein
VNICHERSEAETRRLDDLHRQAQERANAVATERLAADQRAKDLLLSHLTPEQRKTFENNGWFIVKGGKSGDRYKIKTNGYAGNIDKVDVNNVSQIRFCAHTRRELPLHDHHVAQMLAIQYDEEQFLRVANRT